MATITFRQGDPAISGRRQPCGRLVRPGDRRRRVPRSRRALRMRQVDLPAHARRPGARQFRRDPDRRAGRHPRAAEGTRHRDGVPELRAVPAPDGGREHGLRPQHREGTQGRDRASGQGGRRHPRPGAVTWSASRRLCRGASASAWRWAAPSSGSRRCSSWTSRCPTSTPSCASRPARRSPRCRHASASPRSTSPTTRSRP